MLQTNQLQIVVYNVEKKFIMKIKQEQTKIMKNKKGIFSEIIGRKIPHIIGVYVASVWLAVEISDWMSGRFELPEQFSTYVFVGMLSFLPSVILVAWGHGKPGKDNWSVIEKLWIPTNIIIAILTVNYFIRPMDQLDHAPEKNTLLATENTVVKQALKQPSIKEIEDSDNHQSVVSYFWTNKTGDKDKDWMSYGLNWLLSEDIKRTPLISVTTPYNSGSMIEELTKKGFERAIGVPLSLAKKLAQNKSAKWLINGSFDLIQDQIQLTANLYNVESGVQVKSISVKSDNWFKALDQVSNEISSVVLKTSNVATKVIPQLAIMEHTSANIKAIELLISAQNTVTFENDFPKGISQLFEALALDKTFVQAHVLAMKYYSGLGDFNKAAEQAQLALSFDDKLYEETSFLVKASLFSLQGENVKAIKILEKWVELYPQNTNALSILGRNYIVVGNHNQKAKNVFIKLYEKEGAGNKSLLNLAKIYRLENDKNNALKYLNLYKDAHPTQGKSFFSLASTYQQFGELDKAKQMYEEAILYSNKNLKAEIGLARINAAEGNQEMAFSKLDELLEKNSSNQDQFDILSVKQELYLQTGQIIKALEVNNKLEAPVKMIMPPLGVLLYVKGSRINLHTQLQQYTEVDNLLISVKENLKPPFDKLIGAFEKYKFEYQKDTINYKKSLQSLEEFSKSFESSGLKPDILRTKGVIAYWDKDYISSVELFTQGINEAKKSIVSLISTDQVDDLLCEQSRSLIAMKKYDQAFESLDIVTTRTPLFASAYVLKARAYAEMKEFKKMDEQLKIAHKIWQNADLDFIQYQDLMLFEKEIDNLRNRKNIPGNNI